LEVQTAYLTTHFLQILWHNSVLFRFPFTAFENGGGAFLIPYLIVLVVIGRPMYYLEMCLGQFCSKGQVKAWKLAPFFKGVGYTATFASFAQLTYYTILIAITIWYFIASFAKTLPWSECNPEWVESGDLDCDNKTIAELYFL
jgi:solute carrier family 6 amino acid transporter-like protein 5/7/9/14